MQSAIDKAWKYQLLTYPNPAVGATVVKDEDIEKNKRLEDLFEQISKDK